MAKTRIFVFPALLASIPIVGSVVYASGVLPRFQASAQVPKISKGRSLLKGLV